MTNNVEQILETANVAAELVSMAGDYTGLYLTFLFGYLVVAYVVGNQLRRSHAAVITLLFVFWSVSNTFAGYAAMESAAHFSHTYGAGRTPNWGGILLASLQGFGTLAALYFMWSIRHPKEG